MRGLERLVGALALAGVLGLVPVLAVSGCGLLSPRPDRSRFYTLIPAPVSSASPSGALGDRDAGVSEGLSGRTVGVGPVKLPGYLDRHEIATRVGPGRIQYAPLDLWAEPLDQNVTRVLQADLASLLGSAQVVAWPWLGQVDYQIGIQVLRFEPGDPAGANLDARWTLRSGASGEVLASRRVQLVHPVRGAGKAAEVEALSGALSDLSGRLAAALRAAVARSGPSERRSQGG